VAQGTFGGAERAGKDLLEDMERELIGMVRVVSVVSSVLAFLRGSSEGESDGGWVWGSEDGSDGLMVASDVPLDSLEGVEAFFSLSTAFSGRGGRYSSKESSQ
jgi:hypothetical protein